MRLVGFLEDYPNLVQEVGNRLRPIGLAVIRPDGRRGLRELEPRIAVLVSAEPLEERRDIGRELSVRASISPRKRIFSSLVMTAL